MLGQRRRCWPNIKTALDQCLVWVVSCNQFSGYINAVNLYSIGYCWPTLDSPRHARFDAEWFFKDELPTVIQVTPKKNEKERGVKKHPKNKKIAT